MEWIFSFPAMEGGRLAMSLLTAQHFQEDVARFCCAFREAIHGILNYKPGIPSKTLFTVLLSLQNKLLIWIFGTFLPIHRVPTAGIEVLVRGKYHCLTRVNDNFFVGMGLGRLSVPLRVRLTAITGEQLHTTVPAIKNDVTFASEVQYQGINGASELSEKILKKRLCVRVPCRLSPLQTTIQFDINPSRANLAGWASKCSLGRHGLK